jgi:hypothetical protein
MTPADPQTPEIHRPKFYTTEVAVAQFLIHKGYKCNSFIDEDSGDTRVRFGFRDTDALRRDVTDYFRGAMVPAAAYDEAGRTVRRMMLIARSRHQTLIAQRANTSTSIDDAEVSDGR